MACVDSTSRSTIIFEARKIGPNLGMRYREDRRHPSVPRMRETRGSLARSCRRTRLIQGSSRDRDGGHEGI
jgi:hypothetical protein